MKPAILRSLAALLVLGALSIGAPASAASDPSVKVGTTNFVPGSTENNPKITLTDFPSSDYIVVVSVAVGSIYLDPTAPAVETIAGFDIPINPANELGFQGTLADVSGALAKLRYDAPADQAEDVEFRIDIAETDLDLEGFFYNRGDGHYYWAFSDEGVEWDDALTGAQSQEKFGMTGYLATLTSESENDFIAEYTDAQNVWIGAVRVATSCDEEGKKWEWADGPEKDQHFFTQTGINPRVAGGSNVDGFFSAWAANEPNGSCTGMNPVNEDAAVTNWNGVAGQWNDLSKTNTTNVEGYLIEFSGEDSTATTLAKTVGFTILAADDPALPETGAPIALLPLVLGASAVGVGAAVLRRRHG